MTFHVTDKAITRDQLAEALEYLDDSYIPFLSEQIDINVYAEKLFSNAKFIFLKSKEKIIGLLAYYPLKEKSYVSTFGIHKDYQHRGLGMRLFESYLNEVCVPVQTVELEVHKSNQTAQVFYSKYNFSIVADNGDTLLLEKKIQ